MKKLPEGLEPYKRTAEFDAASIPAGLRRSHTTRVGVWGLIHVVQGELAYRILGDAPESYVLGPDAPGVVWPQQPHEIEPLSSDVRCFVEFWRRAQD